MNKSILSLVAIGTLVAGPAIAADLRMPVKAPMAPPPVVTNWTGCYLDGGIGYGMWNQDSFTESDPVHTQISNLTTFGGRGWSGRVGAGCDYQFSSSWVLGVFGDYDFMDVHGQYMEPLTGFIGEEKESSKWAVGARLGYLVTPSLLTYVDGGYTQARFDQVNFASLVVNFPPPGVLMPAHTYTGWFIGGGTEYALSGIVPIHGLFWRTEYRYSQFDTADLPILSSTTGLSIGLADHVKKFDQTITSGLVWRFNFGGPLAARY